MICTESPVSRQGRGLQLRQKSLIQKKGQRFWEIVGPSGADWDILELFSWRKFAPSMPPAPPSRLGLGLELQRRQQVGGESVRQSCVWKEVLYLLMARTRRCIQRLNRVGPHEGHRRQQEACRRLTCWHPPGEKRQTRSQGDFIFFFFC